MLVQVHWLHHQGSTTKRHDSIFLVVQPVHLRQHTRAARARKSANMVSANIVSVLPKVLVDTVLEEANYSLVLLLVPWIVPSTLLVLGKGRIGSALMGSLQISCLLTEGPFGYSR